MRDLLDILAAYESLPPNEPATLATVVRVEGSAYRLPGARMLIDAAARRTGSVSGGCLEADVARRGRLLDGDSPGVLVRYDGAADSDTAWSYALGCDGSIEVFIERLPPRQADAASPAAESLAFLWRCVRQRSAGVLTTIFAAPPMAPLAAGDRLSLQPDAPPAATDDPLLAAIDVDARAALHSGQTATITYQTPAGPVHALVESVRPPLPLIVCGAGHDAVPLTQAAKTLGWHVTVVDRRASYARRDRFPAADAVLTIDLADPAAVPIPTGAAVVIMTHHYPDDIVLLARALASAADYVGVLGPRARTQRMLSELAGAGLAPTREQVSRLHAPIGLDIGAEGAGPVALSIVAEILAAAHDRPGSPLRQREGPIHTPPLNRIVLPQGAAPAPPSPRCPA